MSIPKTQRVKKLIKAAKNTVNVVPEAEGDEVVDDPESQANAEGGAGPTGPTGPSDIDARDRETTNRTTSASGGSSSSADQCLLSGEAKKQIRDKLAIKKCISFTRPEYAMYLPKLNAIGKRELCCISKSPKSWT